MKLRRRKPVISIDDALDVLRAAGWRIRHDREYGVLSGDLLVMTWDAPGAARHYVRTVAQMPWTAAEAISPGSYQPTAENPLTEEPT